MDFDHGSLEAPDGRKRDVPGYYVPEVVDGELWAVPQWTDVGLAAIRPGESGTLPEYRYVSPTFTYDRESRRVLSLGPLALTPYPATHNARPLVLARDRRGAAQVAHLAMSFDDIREAIARALTAVHGWGVEVEDVYADAVVYEVRGPDGSERCFRATYSISSAAGDVVIGEAVEVEAARGARHDRQRQRRPEERAADDLPEGPGDEAEQQPDPGQRAEGASRRRSIDVEGGNLEDREQPDRGLRPHRQRFGHDAGRGEHRPHLHRRSEGRSGGAGRQRVRAAQPHRRQRGQHRPDLHREPVDRSAERHVEPARERQRRG